MTPSTRQLLSLAVATFLFHGCIPLNSYHSGRTIGKNNWEFLGTVNANNTPYSHSEILLFNEDTTEIASSHLELQTSYGLGERWDLGFRINSTFAIGLLTRVQLLGGKTSPAALSLGAEYGLFSGSNYFQVPLHFSFHPNKWLSICITPRFAREWETSSYYSNSKVNYYGWSMGGRIGNTVKLTFEYGLYQAIRTDSSFEGYFRKGLPTMGAGLILPIQKRS